MKEFTEKDVERGHQFPTIYADREELKYAPLWWHKAGLCQTVSGYGCKLTTANKISFNGKLYRIYASCFGNACSNWFIRTINGLKETVYIN